MSVEQQKQAAARHAAELVEDGMVVGLGSGSTAQLVVAELGRRVQTGLRFVGVPSSDETARLATSLGIALATLEEQSSLDIAIDGADEVDPHLNLVKGRGGALLREKIVALAGNRFVVVVDESKRVERLGAHAPIPVEVVPFGWITTRRRLEQIGLTGDLRGRATPYMTDGGNFILDCRPEAALDLTDPATARGIKAQTGVVEHGLFLGITSSAIVGRTDGSVDVLNAQGSA